MVYDELIDRVGLGDIRDKVLAGERLQADDGLRLYACDESPILGYLANIVRERKNGDATYYVRNQHINYTNVCNNFKLQPNPKTFAFRAVRFFSWRSICRAFESYIA